MDFVWKHKVERKAGKGFEYTLAALAMDVLPLCMCK